MVKLKGKFEKLKMECFNFENEPLLCARDYVDFTESSNFTKGCKWSPDGTCILTASDDNTYRIFETPVIHFSIPDLAHSPAFGQLGIVPDWSSVLQVSAGESVYDYQWLPSMNSADPVSCVFASTTRDHPVKMPNLMPLIN